MGKQLIRQLSGHLLHVEAVSIFGYSHFKYKVLLGRDLKIGEIKFGKIFKKKVLLSKKVKK